MAEARTWLIEGNFHHLALSAGGSFVGIKPLEELNAFLDAWDRETNAPLRVTIEPGRIVIEQLKEGARG